MSLPVAMGLLAVPTPSPGEECTSLKSHGVEGSCFFLCHENIFPKLGLFLQLGYQKGKTVEQSCSSCPAATDCNMNEE